MSASIFSLSSLRMRRDDRHRAPRQDWSQQELAELYRVRDRLLQSGLAVAVDTGLTDEGEPWAVFLQSETGDAFVHIARLGGSVIVANLLANVIYRGADFRAITDQMLADAPLVLPRTKPGDAKVVMHPRSVFTAFVAAAVVLSELVRSVEPARASSEGEKAVADTKALFPHLFDRLLARDLNWTGQVGLTSAAAGLITAAVGAVLLSDRADTSDDHTLQVAAGAASSESVHNEVAPTVVATDTRSDDDRPSLLDTATADGPQDDGSFKAAKVVEVERPVTEPAAQPEERHAALAEEPRAGAVQTFDQHSPALDMQPESGDKARVIKTSAIASAPAEAPTQTGTTAPLPEGEKASHSASGVSAKELSVISDAIVVAVLPIGSGDRSLTDLLNRAMARVEPSSAPAASSDTDAKTVTASTEQAQSKSSSWVLFTDVSPKTPLVMTDGTHDVFHFSGQDTTIFNFRFNEDYLLVNGGLDKTDWIKTIDIVGDDVFIVAVDGGKISLIDTHGLIA